MQNISFVLRDKCKGKASGRKKHITKGESSWSAMYIFAHFLTFEMFENPVL